MSQRVLVIEDDNELQNIYKEVLIQEGFSIYLADNGRQGFTLMTQHKPEVIISDVKMEGGNGIEFLDRLARIEYYQPTIIFVSGYESLPIEDFLDRGAEAVFTKPVNFDDLIKCIKDSLLPRKSRWDEARRSMRIFLEKEISLTINNDDKSIESRLVNFGRQGMFLALNTELPTPGSHIKFNFKLIQKRVQINFTGIGLVVWKRELNEPEKPRGIGIKFIELNKEAKDFVIHEINRKKTNAIIPKS